MSASHYTPKSFNKKEWRRIVRETVLKKADHRCAICGAPATDVDWVRHPDNGGRESERNRIACCPSCIQKRRRSVHGIAPGTPKPRKSPPPEPPPVWYYHSPEWRALHKEVRSRDCNQCQYCDSHTAYMVDHIIPRKRGGADSPENLVCCCSFCNKLAGNRVFRDFESKKRWIRSKRGQKLSS